MLPTVVNSSFAASTPQRRGSTTPSQTTPAKRKATATVSYAVTPSPGQTKKEPKKKQTNQSPAPKTTKKAVKKADVTSSFEPLWSNRFTEDLVPVHTLILGTHPSVASLSQEQYYGYIQNAFWWIAGDCLGFRRATAVSPSSGKPYKFADDLRYKDESDIIPYEKQIETLAMKGFAMWDVVGSCERPGSLDQDIRNEKPNDIRGFCQQHASTLRRIVLANGGTSSTLFTKHFRDWLESGELQALEGHDASEKAFGKAILKGEGKRKKQGGESVTEADSNTHKIALISALPVSPAAARYTYAEKRDFWETNVYKPGLDDHESHLRRSD
jgi:G:T/U-mismatch repair DNA glycosylase